MGPNLNTFNSTNTSIPCVTDSLSLVEGSQSLLNQRTANVLQWLSRIRGKIQELWMGSRDGHDSSVTVQFYLTLSNQKPRLQANHLTCDPTISEVHRSSLTKRL